MENQELKHYIDTQLAGGTSPDELKKLLMHHGWAPEIVDAHMPPTVPAAPPLPRLTASARSTAVRTLMIRKNGNGRYFFLF